MLHYWQYFVAIESDLAATTRYVEPASRNMQCNSIEFARLLLAAGSEVDVICKVLCAEHGLTPSPQNIVGYRTVITKHFPQFTRLEIQIPQYKMTYFPWRAWDTDATPAWWTAYNKVKHERHAHFGEANLENAINAVAGLFVLVSYVCHSELRARTAQPWPQMLTLNPDLSADIRCNLRPGHLLPDFATQ